MTALFDHRVVPLATVTDPADVDAMGDGLVTGGLPVVEVALRGDHGLDAIARLAARGDLLVGAGTVLTTRQADEAIERGAEFVVTPGLDPEVVRHVQSAGRPVVPGVLTPTEVQTAIGLGLQRLKLFPANVLDAPALLSAYHAVHRGVTFMPSGGMSQATLSDYLAHPAVFAVSGSWITAVAADGPQAVAERAERAVAAAGGVAR